MQPRLHAGIVRPQDRIDISEFQQPREKCFAGLSMMPVVTRAGKRADQEGPPLSKAVFDGRGMAVAIVAHRPSTSNDRFSSKSGVNST